MTFGERLREARRKKGLTQEELALKIGVAKSTLNGYEKGNREPNVVKIRKLASALGVSSDYLIGWENKKKESASGNAGADPKMEELTALFMMLDDERKDRLLATARDMAAAVDTAVKNAQNVG